MTFVRYGLVQVIAYAIDMGGFLLVLGSGLSGPVVANMAAKLAAGLFAFAAHRRFTFGTGERANTFIQGLRYFALLALNIPLSSGLLALLLLWIPQAPVAKFISDVVIVAATYWVSKLVVFAPAKTQGADGKGQGA
jgi:putative flippase GtrA